MATTNPCARRETTVDWVIGGRLRAPTHELGLLEQAVAGLGRHHEVDRARWPIFRQFKDWAWFLLGAGAGYVGHELGHMFTDLFLGKRVDFVETHLGKIPFFAIQPCCNLTNQQLYVILVGHELHGAGRGFRSRFWWLKAAVLRSKRHAFLKGVLALDIGLSLGYALSGFLPKGIAPRAERRELDVTRAQRAAVAGWSDAVGAGDRRHLSLSGAGLGVGAVGERAGQALDAGHVVRLLEGSRRRAVRRSADLLLRPCRAW